MSLDHAAVEQSRPRVRRKASSSSDKEEFYVSAQVYISPRVAATLRKPTVLYKKSHDRLDKAGESSRNTRGSVDGTRKKIKEKSSWLSLGRNSAAPDNWKTATCRLVEEDEGCTLNIYIDQDTLLYMTVYVSLLNHTDIRPVHHSLFERKDCLGIYCVAGQMQCATPTSEPVILHFADTESMNLWLTLLRAHAQPEVYGRWLSPSDGGLYRMWRQVELTCLQGRNLGSARAMSTSGSPAGADEPPSTGSDGPERERERPEADANDIDVYCEVFVNGHLCGRTTVKRGVGAPDWQERFVFGDLPPFENMEIVVWREKRVTKPAVVGTVVIVLMNFRRGEWVEGWFPVLGGGGAGAGVQAGEMRLRVRVDEEIILPYSEYAGVLQSFTSRNSLDWMRELESKLKLKNISNHLISIAIAKNVLTDNIMELANREVDGTLSSHNTLFRGNTVLTKTMELYMAWYGAPFLEASVGASIRRLCTDKVAIEVDPVRSGKGAKSIEKNVELLVYWCQEFWNCIYEARTQCPPEMRKLFEHIRRLVESRYQVDVDHNRRLPWQSVSAFCFLRFIVPAILHPHLFGIWPGLPEAPVQRSLTLIAKVIQNLANLNATVQKEHFMRGVKEFLTNSLQGMIDYIVVVSTPEPEQTTRSAASATDRHERLRIMNALRRRGSAIPVLHREATPLLPHLLDLPKHLAVVTAVVVRYSRAHSYIRAHSSPPALAEDGHFDDFCSKCLEVEEQALHRVSQLASRPRRQSSSQPSVASPLAASIPLPPSPSSPVRIPKRERRMSVPRRPRKSTRPSTAPDGSDIAIDHSADDSEASAPLSPAANHFGPFPVSRSAPAGQLFENMRERTRSLRRPRAPFAHQPRSSSTDSALMGKSTSEKMSLVSGSTHDVLTDTLDDPGKKRKSIFRGILTRR